MSSLDSPFFNSPKPIVLAFGEVLWDVFPDGKAVLGGAPANFAYRFQQMFGDKYQIEMLSKVGNDELGSKALEELREKGVSDQFIQRDKSLPTGTVSVIDEGNNEVSYIIHPDVAYDNISLDDEMRRLAGSASLICFGTLIQRTRGSRETLYKLLDAAPQAKKVVDINLRRDCYTRETVIESLKRADILKLNNIEAELLTDLLGFKDCMPYAFPSRISESFNIETVVITLGERGAYAMSKRFGSIETEYSPGFSVKIEDVVGSGDSFTAAFCEGYLREARLIECLELTNETGALVAKTVGGMSPIDNFEYKLVDKEKRVCDPRFRCLNSIVKGSLHR